MMTLQARYEAAIAQGEIRNDANQRQILQVMQTILTRIDKKKSTWFGRKKFAQGLYLYGPVGSGKTYLVDLFYQHLESPKARYHFHHFMQQIDTQLRHLQGQKNPLEYIAKQFAKTIRVLCLDEFLVHDVAHAMILAQLLELFFSKGIILIATSNSAPGLLYAKGVHRERFLPAIHLIERHCEIHTLTTQCDYREGREPHIEAYLYPLNAVTTEILEEQYVHLASNSLALGEITIQNRDIPFVKKSDKAIWFEFKTLCSIPRSQLDYLEIAEQFQTVVISNIPALGPNDTIAVILFIRLVDIFYDRRIKLIISAAVPLEHLYEAGELYDSFKRTLSRLKEMRAFTYFSQRSRRLNNQL